MNKDINSSPLNDLQGKGTEIKPDFSGLQNPEVIKNHVGKLIKSEKEATPHRQVLEQLKKQIEPLDFQAIVYPESLQIKEKLKKLNAKQKEDPDNESIKEDILKQLKMLQKCKVNTKHYLILSIEQALKLAEKNKWGLCKNHDFIYLYNGTYWKELDKEGFQKFLGEAAELLGVTKYSARFYQFREQLFKQFLATAYLPTPEADKGMVLINLLNGTFEITPDGTNLRPFNPADFLTYQLPFEYDPEAKAPLFTKYLNRVLPDMERQRVLAEFLGYVFIKHGSNTLKEEKNLTLYGTGANGKSVFFEIVNALLGAENVSAYSLQSLTNENGYFRAKIANKLVNYASEINGNLETSIFKRLVSGEPVEARLPYGQPFTLKQYAKLIFNCNELPKEVEHTNAYFRRFLIIPFDVTIPEAEQDKNLHTKIIENELSGVFNWVLDGLHRLLKQKRFSHCEAAKQALEAYKLESNSVQMFLKDCGYHKATEQHEIIKDLFREYRAFCIEDGMTPFKKTNFIKQLKALGYVVDRITDNKLAVFIECDNPKPF